MQWNNMNWDSVSFQIFCALTPNKADELSSLVFVTRTSQPFWWPQGLKADFLPWARPLNVLLWPFFSPPSDLGWTQRVWRNLWFAAAWLTEATGKCIMYLSFIIDDILLSYYQYRYCCYFLCLTSWEKLWTNWNATMKKQQFTGLAVRCCHGY